VCATNLPAIDSVCIDPVKSCKDSLTEPKIKKGSEKNETRPTGWLGFGRAPACQKSAGGGV
jgi:hypothetical protein